jgi:hypothetical protein
MRLLIGFLAFLSAFQVQAASSTLKSAALPFFQNGDRSFITHAILGPVCSSIRNLKNEPPCSAALLGEPLPKEDDTLIPGQVLGVNLFIGRDFETFYKNKDLFASKDKMKIAESLLGEKAPLHFEGSALLWWRTEQFAFSYQPLRATYFSEVRNQSYPDVSLYAMQEQSLQAQFGGFFDENWRLGAKIRFLDRKFIYEDFNFFLALPNIQDSFQIKNQKALFIEPSLAYELTGSQEVRAWKPLLSLSISQLGWVDKSYEDVPTSPIFDAGFSMSPPISQGDWEIGFNYRFTTSVSPDRKFRLGSIYNWEKARFLFGYDPDEWSLGSMLDLSGLGLGVLYHRIQLPNSVAGGATHADSTSFEIRWTF